MIVPEFFDETVAAVDAKSRLFDEEALLLEEPDGDVELVGFNWLDPLVSGVPCAYAPRGSKFAPRKTEKAVNAQTARLVVEIVFIFTLCLRREINAHPHSRLKHFLTLAPPLGAHGISSYIY